MPKKSHSVGSSKIFQKLCDCLISYRHVHILDWINKDDLEFEVLLIRKNSRVWNDSYLSLFKDFDSLFEGRYNSSAPDYKTDCKVRFRSNMRKLVTNGYLKRLGKFGQPTKIRYKILDNKIPDSLRKKLRTNDEELSTFLMDNSFFGEGSIPGGNIFYTVSNAPAIKHELNAGSDGREGILVNCASGGREDILELSGFLNIRGFGESQQLKLTTDQTEIIKQMMAKTPQIKQNFIGKNGELEVQLLPSTPWDSKEQETYVSVAQVDSGYDTSRDSIEMQNGILADFCARFCRTNIQDEALASDVPDSVMKGFNYNNGLQEEMVVDNFVLESMPASVSFDLKDVMSSNGSLQLNENSYYLNGPQKEMVLDNSVLEGDGEGSATFLSDLKELMNEYGNLLLTETSYNLNDAYLMSDLLETDGNVMKTGSDPLLSSSSDWKISD